MVKLLGKAAMQGVSNAAANGSRDAIVVNACCPSLYKTDLGRDGNRDEGFHDGYAGCVRQYC